MTRPLVLAVLAAALPIAAAAQPASRPAPPDVSVRAAALGLTVTPDQQARISAVGARYAGQTDAAALWAASSEIGALLTPEQVAALAPARGARRDGARPGGARGRRGGMRPGARDGRRDGARGGRRGEARPGRAADDPSRAAMRGIRVEFAPRVRALREQRRAGQITPAQFADQQRALRAEVETRLDAVRTPEQRQRTAEMRARRDAAQAARTRVLGLTPQQQQALDALRTSRPARTEGQTPEARRAAGEARRAQAAAVLTPPQRATLAVHSALTRGRHAGRGPRR